MNEFSSAYSGFLANSVPISPARKATQLEIGEIRQIPTDVESTMYDSFSLEMLYLSVTGLITFPLVIALK